MIECAQCGRLYPEVLGAPTQVCPHCGHETAEKPAAPPGATARATPVDPVGALTEAARVGAREYPRLLVLFLPALVVEIGVSLAIDAYTRAMGLPIDVETYTSGQQMQLLGVALPLLLLIYTVRFATWTFVAARVLDASLGGRRVARWRSMLRPAIVMGFVLVLTFAAGFLLLVVGLLVFLHWFMYAPAQLAAGAPTVGAAFDRSRRFARDHRTYGYTALVCLAALAVLVPYFVTDALGGTAGLLVPAIISWLGGPIVPLLAASYVALAAKNEPLVAPVASTTTGRAVTKCPRCATLIPYSPTGEAVEVVCPVCGLAGKVL